MPEAEMECPLRTMPERFYYFKGRAGQEMRNPPYGLMRDVFAFRFRIQESDAPPVARGQARELEDVVAETLVETGQFEVFPPVRLPVWQ
jgi:hypothetical protein